MVTVPARRRAQLIEDLLVSAFVARLERVAIAVVTAWRCPSVSPMSVTYR